MSAWVVVVTSEPSACLTVVAIWLVGPRITRVIRCSSSRPSALACATVHQGAPSPSLAHASALPPLAIWEQPQLAGYRPAGELHVPTDALGVCDDCDALEGARMSESDQGVLPRAAGRVAGEAIVEHVDEADLRVSLECVLHLGCRG